MRSGSSRKWLQAAAATCQDGEVRSSGMFQTLADFHECSVSCYPHFTAPVLPLHPPTPCLCSQDVKCIPAKGTGEAPSLALELNVLGSSPGLFSLFEPQFFHMQKCDSNITSQRVGMIKWAKTRKWTEVRKWDKAGFSSWAGTEQALIKWDIWLLLLDTSGCWGSDKGHEKPGRMKGPGIFHR